MQEVDLQPYLKSEDYASGIFLGDNPEIQNLSPEDRLFISAWRHGCPQRLAVVGYYGNVWLEWWKHQPDNQAKPIPTSAEILANGIAITRRRYDECDYNFGYLVSRARELNRGDLAEALTAHTPRRLDEPVGKYEPFAVPESHQSEMAPLATLLGYALSRVLIEQFGWGEKEKPWGSGARTWERYQTGLKDLDKALKQAKDPYSLLAILAREVTKHDADPDKVLGHLLDEGIAEEENNVSEYARVHKALAVHARGLWRRYQALLRA